MGRPGKRTLGCLPVSVFSALSQIGAETVMQNRCIRVQCPGWIGDRRQRLVIDGDRLSRFNRLLSGLGDHRGHGIADMAHPVSREHRTTCQIHRRTVVEWNRKYARNRTKPPLGPIGRGEDPKHPWHGSGVLAGDARYQRMGVRASHKCRPGRIGYFQVGGELTVATQKWVVLIPG